MSATGSIFVLSMPVGMFHSVRCSEQKGGRFSEVSITLSTCYNQSVLLCLSVGERAATFGRVRYGWLHCIAVDV